MFQMASSFLGIGRFWISRLEDFIKELHSCLQLAGDQKFTACPVQMAQIPVTSGVLKMQLFPTGIRDAPAIKGVWVQKIG
jgi:hypothetical protein